MNAVVTNPVGFELLLEMMRARKWTFVYYPNRENVEALAAFFEYRSQGIVDVSIITSETYAYGYRGILTASPDPFEPNFILWNYSDNPVHVCRAMLALPAPGLEGSPTVPRGVPDHLTQAAERFRRNRTVRPPQRPEGWF